MTEKEEAARHEEAAPKSCDQEHQHGTESGRAGADEQTGWEDLPLDPQHVDKLWWAITTLTTVGYGDFYPITPMGRVMAVLLMLGGISLIGIVTATVAAWIVQRVADVDAAEQAATAGQIEQLHGDIAQLTQMVAELPGDNVHGESASV